MCGIAGIFNLNGEPVSPVILRKMTDTIAHRGPDGEGFYTDNFVGLGHRRLSIIDLSPAGHQPMITPDGQFVLTYNGEVYNFQDLRAELQSLGHQFRSRTDSEVVLHAFAEWGFNCVNRFNGMFAFAIWDKSRQELFLARDRYGIKPLFLAVLGQFSFVWVALIFLNLLVDLIVDLIYVCCFWCSILFVCCFNRTRRDPRLFWLAC